MPKVAKIAAPVLTSGATNYTAFIGKDRAEQLFLDMVEKAENGDPEATKLVADRIFPKAKPANYFRFRFDKKATPVEQMGQILTAVSKGQIDVDSANTLIQAMSRYLESIKSNYDHQQKVAIDKDVGVGYFDPAKGICL